MAHLTKTSVDFRDLPWLLILIFAMTRIAALPESDATDKVARTYDRIREVMEADAVPDVFLAMGRVPAFLADFYMNFKKFVLSAGALDAKTKVSIALAVSLKEGASDWVDFYANLPAARELGESAIPELASLVATNATYNTFFKFRSLSGSDLFEGMSVGLRAHAFADTGFDEKTVELVNVAISNLNACGPCVSGHVKKVRGLGVSDEALLETIQCAAVAYAGVQFSRSANC